MITYAFRLSTRKKPMGIEKNDAPVIPQSEAR